MATTTDNTARQAIIDELGLSVSSEFVPFSQSRNAKPSPKLSKLSLNWKITVHRNGRDVLTCDYSAGIAHCPSYKQDYNGNHSRMTVDTANAVRQECESGRKVFGANGVLLGSKPITPNPLDVLSSLASEADTIDYPSFEDWATEFGYDPDSRTAESIYRQCLETALKLRAALGDNGLARLREAFIGY